MDARLVTLLIGLLGLGTAAYGRVPEPVDRRVLSVDGVWWEASEIEPAPPTALVDGSVLRWDVPAPACEAVEPARLSLNAATRGQLEALPGIGPALAQRIIADRPYRQVADLDRVRGIGPATLARLRPLLRP